MRWLKSLGRLLVILTHEDRSLDPATISRLLLIGLPADRHLPLAAAACRARFPRAELTILDLIRLPSGGYWRPLIGALRRQRRQSPSALVLTSLHPAVVALACLWFRCHRLLFNRWEEWFLIRPRSWGEILQLEPGADVVSRPRVGPTPPILPQFRWCGWPGWLQSAERWIGRLVQAFLARPLAVLARLVALVGYLSATLTLLFWRRWRYRREARQAADPKQCRAAA